jgi:[acyl-carrier-protein] S-malonyltransferase
MSDLSITAFLFPGQGSQVVGMAADVAHAYPEAAAILEQADQILGLPFSKLMAEGPADQLDDTVNTQPALYIASIAILRALEAKHGALTPVGAAGHSLGELTALTAAGALPFADGVKLVRERARLMKEAGQAHPGAMAALLGPTVAEAESICAAARSETGQPLVVANDNCPGQVVISGDSSALERGLEIAKERGVKRALKLAVSVAAHSPLMQQASLGFNTALASTPFIAPRYPVISNALVQPLRTIEEIRQALSLQLTSPVRWTECVRTLNGLGATKFVEIGSKDVLTGLLKRIDKEWSGTAINSADAVATFQ